MRLPETFSSRNQQVETRDQAWNPSPDDYYAERMYHIGFHLGAIAYGAHCVVFLLCSHALLKQRRRRPCSTHALLAYVTFMFICGTLCDVFNEFISEFAFIHAPHRSYYLSHQNEFHPRWYLLVYVLEVVPSWMQDGLLLYRFLLIFGFNWYLLPVPLILLLVSIISSSILLAQLTNPALELWRGTVDFAICYLSSTMALTVFVTVLIVARLVHLRHVFRALIASEFLHVPYLSVSAMLVESSALYTLSMLALAVLVATNNQAWNALYPIAAQIEMVAPELIILRVARGQGFTSNTLRQLTRHYSTDPATASASASASTSTPASALPESAPGAAPGLDSPKSPQSAHFAGEIVEVELEIMDSQTRTQREGEGELYLV